MNRNITNTNLNTEHRILNTQSPGYRTLWLPDLLGLILLVLAATLPFLTPTLDIRLLSLFHHPGAGRPWPHEFDRFWRFLYTVGTWPALITALSGLGLVVAARYRPSLARWRRHAAFVFLTLVLGPGLFVNTLFKDHWGRPRPRQVTELGGTMTYQCFYEQGQPGRGKSFPCGHSSMGYYFVVFYFLMRRRHKRIAFAALAAAMAYGSLIGVARMAAGAHFASDVLWSAVFPSLVAWILYYGVLRIPRHEDNPGLIDTAPALWRSKWLVWIAPPLAAAAIAAVVLGTPHFAEIRYAMELPAGTPATLKLVTERCGITTRENPALKDRILISGEVQGFGWPWSKIQHSATWTRTEGMRVLTFSCRPAGHFSELDGDIVIETPPGIQVAR